MPRRAASPDTGAAILSGVAKIRFNFRIVGSYGTIWREFDVTGTGLGGGPTHNISGTVTLSGSGLSGVTVSDGTRTATTAADGKISVVGGVTADLSGKVRAGDLVGHVAGLIGGKGGGRPDMAMGGGTDAAALPGALAGVKAWVQERV